MLKKTFEFIFLITLAFLSFSTNLQDKYLDITQNRINSISSDTKKILSKINAPLTIQIYSPNVSELATYNILLAQYKMYSKLIKTELHQTDNQRIAVVEYKQRQKSSALETFDVSEQQLSSLIQYAAELTFPDGEIVAFKHSTPKDLNYQQTTINSFLYNYGFVILLPLFLICVGFYLEPR